MNFALSNVEIMTNCLFQPIWNDFDEGLNLRLHVKRDIYRALIVPNDPKWQSLNPHKYMKKDHR